MLTFRKMKVSEIRIRRWICEHTCRDRFRNKLIHDKVGVASVTDKRRNARLRWFAHVKGRAPVRTEGA